MQDNQSLLGQSRDWIRSLQDTERRDSRTLLMLRRAADEFWQNDSVWAVYGASMWHEFAIHALKEYGIRIHYDQDWISPVYEVVDEKLHTLFLLKWQ